MNNPAYHSPEQVEFPVAFDGESRQWFEQAETQAEATPNRKKLKSGKTASTKPSRPSLGEQKQGGDGQPVFHNRLRTLTALRFIAAILILLDHFQYIFIPVGSFGIFPDFTPSVSFFFMLSGFMLANTYLPRPPASTAQFVLKRLARVWPLHIVVVLLTIWLLPDVTKKIWPMAQAPWIVLSNVFLLQAWVPVSRWYFSFNVVTWSLSSLMFCYTLFPTILRHLRKFWLLFLLGSAALCGAMIFISTHFPLYSQENVDALGFYYISPLSRLFEFCLGMSAALLVERLQDKYTHRKALATSVEVISTAFLLGVMGPLRLWFDSPAVKHVLIPAVHQYMLSAGIALIPVFLFIIVFAMARGRLSDWLSKPVPVFLGEMSFGIYIFHVNLIHLYLYPIALKPNAPFPTPEKLVTYFVMLLGLSYLSSRFFEKPINRLLSAFINPRPKAVQADIP